MQQEHPNARLKRELPEPRALSASDVSQTVSGPLPLHGTRLADSASVPPNASPVIPQSASVGECGPSMTGWEIAKKIAQHGERGGQARRRLHDGEQLLGEWVREFGRASREPDGTAREERLGRRQVETRGGDVLQLLQVTLRKGLGG